MLELNIDITVRNPQSGYSGLNVRETLNLNDMDFIEICAVLGEFKTLADKYRKGV